ncbi:MAG: glycosyltransferase family 2 protein [Candidatus Paceibacterota bacterium]
MITGNNKKISCIIPAYNEGKRIQAVLEIVASHPLIDEIIVIDDGSSDDTIAVVEKFKNIKLIIHNKNTGKSISLYDGIRESSGDFIFLLDADLAGLTIQNINDLISPIINKVADVSISLRRNAPRLWHRLGMDYISGERVLPRHIITPHLEKIISLKPFGFEVFLNKLIIANNSRIKIVPWLNVDSPYKITKNGLWVGLKGDFFMMVDIFRTISIFGPIYQIIKMRNLRVK